MIIWWRAGIVAGGVMVVALAFFSFLLYQRVNMVANKPAPFPAEESSMLFSPTLLDDIRAFWEKRTVEID